MSANAVRMLAAVVCLACASAPAHAQSTVPTVSDLEQRAAGSQGLERARILAEIAERLRTEDPGRAIDRATEAIRLLKHHPDARAHVHALNALSWALMQRGEMAEATARAAESRVIAERSGDRAGLGRAINNLGVIEQRRGHALEAVGFFEQSLAIYREAGIQAEIANVLNNLGFVHGTNLADYEKSLEYHVEALRVREALKDENAIALSLNNIGIVYARLGEQERALQYFERSLEIRRANGSMNRGAGTLGNIGDVYLDLGDLGKAFSHHQQSLEIRRRIGDKGGIANSLKNLGQIYAGLGKSAEARRYFGDALTTARQIQDRTTETQALLGLAALERQLGRGGEAAALASRALAIAESTKARELERRSLDQLAAAEELAGRPAAALAAFKRLKALEDRIFADDRAMRIDMLERRYQAEKHLAENERLRAEQALNVLQASRSRLQRNAVAGAGVLMLVIGLVLYRRRVDAARLASELSVTDALTGLRNRRFVQQTIDADVAGALRRAPADPDSGLVFMLIDVDHFKAVNDTHGHKVGDAMLAAIADILRSTCRASDTIARWGGEEFLIVCRATPPREAAVLAERLRTAVSAHTFVHDDVTIAMTCSIGFAPLPFAGRDLTWEQAVALADQALYEAKRQGRNRWVDARYCGVEGGWPGVTPVVPTGAGLG